MDEKKTYILDLAIFLSSTRVDWKGTSTAIHEYIEKKYPDIRASEVTMTASNLEDQIRKYVRKHRVAASYKYKQDLDNSRASTE